MRIMQKLYKMQILIEKMIKKKKLQLMYGMDQYTICCNIQTYTSSQKSR